MRISYDELIEMGACDPGLERFVTQTNDTREPVEVTSLIGGENTVGDLLWLAGKRFPKARIVTFAIGCARAVEHFNDDPRVKAAIDAAQAWVDDPTEENRVAARAAANSAVEIRAARAAGAAANSAARAAALADANAAWTAAQALSVGASEDVINDLLRELFA